MVDVVARPVGEHRVDEHRLDLGSQRVVERASRGVVGGCSSSKSQPIRPRSRFVAATYALINIDDAETGLLSPPRTTIPYSVSIPHTLGSAMT
jgi:hypothetical protein